MGLLVFQVVICTTVGFLSRALRRSRCCSGGDRDTPRSFSRCTELKPRSSPDSSACKGPPLCLRGEAQLEPHLWHLLACEQNTRWAREQRTSTGWWWSYRQEWRVRIICHGERSWLATAGSTTA